MSDVKLKSSAGEVLFDKPGFAKSVLESHNANMEFLIDFTLNLTGVPAGRYKFEYTIHDVSTTQSSTFEQDIEIAAGS